MMQFDVIDECGARTLAAMTTRAVDQVAHRVQEYSGMELPPHLRVRLVTPRTLRRESVRLLRSAIDAAQRDYPDIPDAAVTAVRMFAVPASRLAVRMGWRGIAGQFFPSVMDGIPQILLCPKALRLIGVNALGLRLTMAHELTHAAQEHANPTLTVCALARVMAAIPGSKDQVRTEIRESPHLSTVMEGHAQWVHLRVCRDLYGRDMRERKTWVTGDGAWSYRAMKVVAKMNPVIARKATEYDDGETFVSAVFNSGGLHMVNRLWTDLDALPGRRELDDPTLWVERVGDEN